MRHSLIFIFVFLVGLSYGQNFSYPTIKGKIRGQQLFDFVPAGWTILDSATGDLNKDGVNDAAIILQYKDSVTILNSDGDTVLTQPRILLILLKNSISQNFVVTEQSNSFILKHDNAAMNEPFQEIRITNGTVEIAFHIFYKMGSWYVTNAVYKFRYHKGQFALIGADLSSFHRATHDYEDYSYNFLTRKRSLTKGNDNTQTKKTIWNAIKISSLKTLQTLNEPFTWEVEKGVYL